jgi:hypothetical protein
MHVHNCDFLDYILGLIEAIPLRTEASKVFRRRLLFSLLKFRQLCAHLGKLFSVQERVVFLISLY